MAINAQRVMDDPEMRELFVESWPKKCSCGQSFTEEQWEAQAYVGLQRIPPEYGLPDMELRNCGKCGSTMAIVVPGDFAK